MPPPKSHPSLDLRLHVVAAVLEPVAILARLGGLTLDELHELTTQAYFNELRTRGLSWNQMARRLGRSRTTVATLAKRLKTHAPVLDSDRFVMQRRIVALLAAHGPLSTAELVRRLRANKPEVSEQLERLREDGVLEARGSRHAVRVELLELTGDDVARRVSALRHFTQSIAQVLYQRFLAPGDSGAAFARTVTFRSASAKASVGKASDVYRELREWVEAEDRGASAARSSSELSLLFAVAEAPDGYPWNPRD